MRFWIGLFLIINTIVCGAQVISGKIYDNTSQVKLSGATIRLVGTENGISSDNNGDYYLINLKPGRHSLEVSFVGYSSILINDIWVKSGVVTTQDIYLERSFSNLDEVVVSANNRLSVPGRLIITEEQINRYAATYYDPARLATSSPDVAITNDQNNQISVRGLSPSYNVWRFEGAEIINPNHLSNAGTFLDQPSATGGGVNMLSAQMLSQSAFLYGSFDSQYGNSVGGIFDMYLKKGNTDQKQYTAQASLIGFDLASEGPIKTGSPITYAINYRYSFTGLLTNFGVDFGGESIGFQDLAFNIASPIGQKSKIKFFGVGGQSFNDFEHKSYEESEVEKDRNDILYDNQTGIVGASLNTSFTNGSLTNSIVLSGYQNQRDQRSYAVDDVSFIESNNDQNRSILSFNSKYQHHFGALKWTSGVMINHYKWKRVRAMNDSDSYSQSYFQPYTQLDFNIAQLLAVSFGITHNQLMNRQSTDPRLNLVLRLNSKSTLSGGVGKYSQLLNPHNFFFSNAYGLEVWDKKQFGFIQSDRLTLGYQFETENFGLGVEGFYYQFPKVSNIYQEKVIASSYGLSVLGEQSFSKNYYFRLGGSLFQSTLGERTDNHNNTQYNLSLSGGKEWVRSKGDKRKSFAANLKFLYQGGLFYDGLPLFPNLLDANYSIDPYRTDPFLRLDLRLIWTRHKEGRTSSISLDIQNATNYQNESFRYYDFFTGQEESQYNLGLIPILTYRVEW